MASTPRTPCRKRLAALALLAVALACGVSADTMGEGSGAQQFTCPIPIAVPAPTFRGHLLPALTQNCGSGSASTCHGPGVPVGHISFDPALGATAIWSSLVDVDPSSAPSGWKRVAPGHPERSWLVEKVSEDDPGGVGQAWGNRMPYGLPNLCAATIQTIVSWIANGAAND